MNQNFNSKPGKEHWLGLKAINKITASGTSMQLKIEMEKFDGTSSYAQYDDFLIKDQVMQVLISLCTYHQMNPFWGFRVKIMHCLLTKQVLKELPKTG